MTTAVVPVSLSSWRLHGLFNCWFMMRLLRFGFFGLPNDFGRVDLLTPWEVLGFFKTSDVLDSLQLETYRIVHELICTVLFTTWDVRACLRLETYGLLYDLRRIGLFPTWYVQACLQVETYWLLTTLEVSSSGLGRSCINELSHPWLN